MSPLFTAEVKGKQRRLVSVVGKDGLLHILDRESREHLYEVAVSRRQNVDLPITREGVHVCPGPLGGVQWNGPAFNPRTNMLYVRSVDWCGTFKKAEELRHVVGQLYLGGTWIRDPVEQARGWLTAIDASTATIRSSPQGAATPMPMRSIDREIVCGKRSRRFTRRWQASPPSYPEKANRRGLAQLLRLIRPLLGMPHCCTRKNGQ